jgi:hypothetical protein
MIRNQYKDMASARAEGLVPMVEVIKTVGAHPDEPYELGGEGEVLYAYQDGLGEMVKVSEAWPTFLREEPNPLGNKGEIVYVYVLAELPEDVRGWLSESK